MAKQLPVYLLLLILASAIVSCNSSSDYEETVASSSVAVKTFTLAEDDSVLSNLDSVFFTIDLNTREIYNADSLPKGTNVTKLIAKISYPLVSSATIHVTGGKVMKDSTINYGKNPSDSIDFTGKVTLTIVSEDKAETGVYTLKVNVHNMDPDSLYWNRLARRDLPAITTPVAQKTVEYKGVVNCLLKETNRYVLSTSSDPSAGNSWNKKEVNFSFTPVINSFTATDDALYILSDKGMLYKSTDGYSWISCNAQFYSLTAGYEKTLLGITKTNGNYYHATYPATTQTLIEEEFPISGSSPAMLFTTEWATTSQLLIMGGVDKNGNSIGECWGYDGSNWGKISTNGIPGTEGCVLVPYFTYKVNSRWIATKYTTLLAIGGKVDGDVTKKVYVSYDFGVNWKLGDDLLQFPDYIPAFQYAQALVLPTEMSSKSYDGWVYYQPKDLPVWNWVIPATAARSYEISWECPYIYLFGGTNKNGLLQDNMWKGVLNRLSFKPLI